MDTDQQHLGQEHGVAALSKISQTSADTKTRRVMAGVKLFNTQTRNVKNERQKIIMKGYMKHQTH